MTGLAFVGGGGGGGSSAKEVPATRHAASDKAVKRILGSLRSVGLLPSLALLQQPFGGRWAIIRYTPMPGRRCTASKSTGAIGARLLVPLLALEKVPLTANQSGQYPAMVTIAICAVIPEGVVFGADSTSTRTTSDGAQRYLDNEQKVFEVGEGSTFGVLTWGLGQVGDISHRTRVALLADDLEASPPKTVKEAAGRFANQLWAGYEQAYRVEIDKQKAIQADPNVPKQDKDRASSILQSLAFGFCIAGRAPGSRTPEAYEINVDSSLTTAPQPQSIAQVKSWGANLFIFRALGVATNPCGDILATGKWGGTPAELANALTAGATPLQLPMPLRETIDAVHCLLQMTIKFMKFTSLPPTCGGSIELATVTSDRRFRWVRHKRLSAALSTGEFHEQ